jgi:hypothetical protein
LAREKARTADLRLALQKEKEAHELLRKQHFTREQILGEVPFGHQFPVVLMYLAVFFQVNLGLSYRQCSEVLAHFLELLQCPIASPSYSTIRVWVHKMACHVLQSPILDDGLGMKWVLVVDESAAIGKEKMLSILATPLLKQGETQALCAVQMQVLAVETGYSWTGEKIVEVLTKGLSRLQGTVVGIISDRCSNLLKAVRLSGFQHINDCTHWMASCLEKLYAKEVNFLALMSALGKVRQQWTNSEYCAFVPPKMRTGSRFLNLFEIVAWANNILGKWDSLASDMQVALSFLLTYRELIATLAVLCDLIKKVSKELKIKGIEPATLANLQALWKEVSLKNEAITFFQLQMELYVQTIQANFEQADSVIASIPCCSDVIESQHGSYKMRGNKAGAAGFSDDVKVVALYNQRYNTTVLNRAMTTIKVKDIAQWNSQNCVQGLAQMKRKMNPKPRKEKPKQGTTKKAE